MAGKRSIFEYEDYREFLRDRYAELKSRERGFSFRSFSRLAGFKSPSVLKGVMDGQRNIALHSIEKFSRALRLNQEESAYFHRLVLMNQSKTLRDREQHAEQLIHHRKLRELRPLAASQFRYYSRWYFVPIRELVGQPGFREDPEWIARRLSPRITAVEAAMALADLRKLGLIGTDAQGRLVQTDANVSTGDEVISVAIARWHQEMLHKAAESIELHEADERDISAVTIGVSAETVSRLKQMIQAFRKAIIEECSRDPSPRDVYQLGVQLFPLTGPRSTGGS